MANIFFANEHVFNDIEHEGVKNIPECVKLPAFIPDVGMSPT